MILPFFACGLFVLTQIHGQILYQLTSPMRSRSEHFQTLVERQPENELFRFSLAQALVAEGRPNEAVPHYEFCVAKKADWMMPRILLGKLQLAAGKSEDARKLFANALTLAIDQHHEEPEQELRALLADLSK